MESTIVLKSRVSTFRSLIKAFVSRATDCIDKDLVANQLYNWWTRQNKSSVFVKCNIWCFIIAFSSSFPFARLIETVEIKKISPTMHAIMAEEGVALPISRQVTIAKHIMQEESAPYEK